MGKKAEQDKRNRRKSFEFPDSTKTFVIKRCNGICEKNNCSRRAVEFHHVIPVAIARQWGLSDNDIQSPENCLFLCGACHMQEDAMVLSVEDISYHIVSRFPF